MSLLFDAIRLLQSFAKKDAMSAAEFDALRQDQKRAADRNILLHWLQIVGVLASMAASIVAILASVASNPDAFDLSNQRLQNDVAQQVALIQERP